MKAAAKRMKRTPVAFEGWRPGISRNTASCADLVSELLLVTADLPEQQVAKIVGVSPATIRRWRRTPGRNFGRSLHRRIKAYLATSNVSG